MLKILLADDSMTAQNMGKKILTDAGYDVVTVSNGAAAVKKLPEVSPDIVLLDIYMPGYNGLEVCERIKSDPRTAQIPVLLTVGKLEPFLPEDGMRVKAEGVVIKPFEATDLLAVVSRMAERVPPPAPSPVMPVAVPTIAIPDYEDLAPVPQPELKPEPSPAPWADTTTPAFGEDLLESPTFAASATSEQDRSAWAQPAGTSPTAVASPFGDFEIELEPLPATPGDRVGEMPQAGFTIPEQPSGDSGIALPMTFELDEAAAENSLEPTQPLSCSDAVAACAPFTPEVFAPEQVEAGFEAALATFEAVQQNPVLPDESIPPSDSQNNSLEVHDEAGAETADSGLPDLAPTVHDNSADELSRTLQEALAAIEEPASNASHAEAATSEFGVDLAEDPTVSAPAPVVAILSPFSPQPKAEEFPGRRSYDSVFPDAVGTVIDLDSILGEPSAHSEETPAPVAAVELVPTQLEPRIEAAEVEPAALPAVPELSAVAEAEAPAVEPVELDIARQEEPLQEEAPEKDEQATVPLDAPAPQLDSPAQPEAAASAEGDFDANLVFAEQVAERVLQRLKPKLVEEIRNVLREM